MKNKNLPESAQENADAAEVHRLLLLASIPPECSATGKSYPQGFQVIVDEIGVCKAFSLISRAPTRYDKGTKRVILNIPKPKLNIQIVERLGPDFALKVASKFGGQAIYVPKRSESDDLLVKELGEHDAKSLVLRLGGKTLDIPEPLKPSHYLVKILGRNDALKLAYKLGGGRSHSVNCMPVGYLEFRNEGIIRDTLLGLPIKETARLYNIGERHIRDLMRETPQDVKDDILSRTHWTACELEINCLQAKPNKD